MSEKVEKKRVRAQGFCITVNNYTQRHIDGLKTFYTEDPNCQYLIYGEEVAPRTGTKHLQAYIYYKKRFDLNKVRKWFKPWHVEAQKSSKNAAAYSYCMEDGNYTEFGERPKQGHRTDLLAIARDIEKGRPMKSIAREYPNQFCQYSRQFAAYKKLLVREKTQLIAYDPKDMESMDATLQYTLDGNYEFLDGTQYYDFHILYRKKIIGEVKYVIFPYCAALHDKYDRYIDIFLFPHVDLTDLDPNCDN